MFGRPTKVINIDIEDYVMRLIESNGSNNISSIKIMEERVIPYGLIENGKIIDEIGFFEYMKDLVKELVIKHRHVRFYVPNSLVIMRQVEFPADLRDKDIHDFFKVEIGKSLHLPFKNPVFDVHYNENVRLENDIRMGTFFAAPREELVKYTEILADVSLKPVAADVLALGIYRYFHHTTKVNREKVYLFVELNATSINLSIFRNHDIEFLRFQNLDLHLINRGETGELVFKEDADFVTGILEDQISELERIMNFYRFSIQKGEKMVDEIILLGDHPELKSFYQKVNERFEIPVQLLKGVLLEKKDKEVESKYIPALGLALKEIH
ncbi:type IV pilus biogenesis protein PilM [Paucisalibacillus globulus]|uniref:type IV pilus biogenesis protein PilM n=1 Tax=Paucisalibacillus globulus TaxID=351095 RepID=UPI00040BFEC4|nr:pilus assembly protein PilM [Paucisalibacillus globulus]